MLPRSCAKYRPKRYVAAICARNAFVDATAISGPACVYRTASDSRGIDEPFVLQIASVRAPCSFAYRSAMSVSIVSPDCEIVTINVVGVTIGSR